MKVIKKETQFGHTILLDEEDKFIRFTFGGNGDLYWSIHNKCSDIENEQKSNFFVITKENYDVYRLFEELFSDLENINIFDLEDDIPFYIETEEEKREYLINQQKDREEEIKEYRLLNRSNYNELFDSDEKKITWYSDEVAHEVANILKIRKEDDSFRLDFYIQPRIDGYDEDFHSANYIPIRFRNSGSSYDPFNFVFMRMYNEMKKIDDVNDFGHQIHIEEYLYEKEKKLVRK